MVSQKIKRILDVIVWGLGLVAVGILLYGIVQILVGNG